MKLLKTLNLPEKIFALTGIITFGIFSYFVVKTAYWTRMFADDYCTAGILRLKGFWGAQIYWYKTWSGRFSYDLAVHFSEKFGLIAIKLLPIILIGLFVASLTSLLFVLLALDGSKTKRVLSAFLLAIFITPLIVMAAPNIYQILYWQTGSLTYFIPFIMFNAVLSLIYLKTTTRNCNCTRVLLIALLAFIAGGFSESYVVLQILILLMLVVYGVIWGKKDFKGVRDIIIALLFSAASMVMVIVAPGNAVRSASLPARMSIFQAVYQTVLKSGYYIMGLLINKPFMATVFVLLVLGFVFSKYFIYEIEKSLPPAISRFLFFLVCGFGVVCAVFLPGLYALGVTPPDRTLFLIIYPLLALAFIFGVFGSSFLEGFLPKSGRSLLSVLVVAAILALSLLWYSRYRLELGVLNSMRAFGKSWDIQNATLEADGGLKEAVMVSVVQPIGALEVIWTNREGWVNSCAATYYKLPQITGK